MGADAWITLVVLVVAFGAMAMDRLPVPAAMAAALVALLLAGVVDQDQALGGFASSAPVTIAALYVLAGAATVTGAITPFVDRILGPVNGEQMAGRTRLARLTVSAAAMSSVLPNTPLVALMAPRVVIWSRRAGHSASAYLMPLSFAAMLGGVVTVIGTSTNLVISDLLRASGAEPLGVFEITGLGLPVAVVGVGLLVALAPVLLADRGPVTASVTKRYTMALRVVPGGLVSGRSVEQAGLRRLHGVFLAGLERGGRISPASPDTPLADGDLLYFVGDVTDVLDLEEIAGLESAEAAHVVGAGDQPDARLHEVVISEGSELAGSTLKDRGFRSRYGAAVLAIRRHEDDLPGKLGTAVLRSGDVLLVLAGPEFSRQWSSASEFSLVAAIDEPPPARRERSWMALLAIAAMVALAVSGVLSLMEASLVAASGILVLRVISPTEARRAVNLGVVLTLALSISLGTAVASSGLAGELARVLGAVGEPFGDTGRLLAVLVATMVLTELLSNGAAAALMFPIAVATATAAGSDPRAMAIVVLIGASCSFLSPIGYQTNLMVYGLGGYRFADYTRLGLPLTIATLVVTPLVAPLAVGLR